MIPSSPVLGDYVVIMAGGIDPDGTDGQAPQL
jgi:hypothetical protein